MAKHHTHHVPSKVSPMHGRKTHVPATDFKPDVFPKRNLPPRRAPVVKSDPYAR